MMLKDGSLENAIRRVLENTGSRSLDDLVQQFPNHAWSEIFAAVDRMSRDGRLMLSRFPRTGYRVSPPLREPADLSTHQEVHP